MIVASASVALIISAESLLDVVADVPSLLFVNDIGGFVGDHLVKYLNVHMNEATSDENFLQFEYTQE